jgi:membrane associated rhomboid family serine protease
MCDRCGQPTPSNLPQCVNCGAISAHAVVADEQARAESRFMDALFSRATPVTFALLIINVVVFALMAVVSRGSDDPATLVAYGAKTNALLRRGEWFRLVTPIFIHAGPLHLVLNSYALWVVGPQVEKLYGSARFLLIYLLAGIGGVAGSYFGQGLLGKSPDMPSVGASGAIFGLFGVLAVFGFKYRHELPPAIRGALSAGVLPVIVINLVIGFSVSFIDNAAHIGGLLTGVVLALVIPYIAPGRERVSKVGLLILALCAFLIVYCFAQAYQNRAEHLAWRSDIIKGFLDGVNATQSALRQAFRSDFENSAPQDKKAAIDAVSGAIEKLQQAQAPDQQSEQIRLELLRIARRQLSLMTEPNGGKPEGAGKPDSAGKPGAAAKMDEVLANYDDYEKAWGRLDEWVRTVGAKHGLTMGGKDNQSN